MKIVKIDSQNKVVTSGWIIAQYVVYIEQGIFTTIKFDDILYHSQECKTHRSYLNYLVVVLVVCYIQVTNALSSKVTFLLVPFLINSFILPNSGH